MDKDKDSTNLTSTSELALVSAQIDTAIGDDELRGTIHRILSKMSALAGLAAFFAMPANPVLANPTPIGHHRHVQQAPPDHFNKVSDSKTAPKLKIPGLSHAEAEELENAVRLKFTRTYNNTSHTTTQHTPNGAKRNHALDKPRSGTRIPNRLRSAGSTPTESTSSGKGTVNLELELSPVALLFVLTWLRQRQRSSTKHKLMIKYHSGNEVEFTQAIEAISEEKLEEDVIETCKKILAFRQYW